MNTLVRPLGFITLTLLGLVLLLLGQFGPLVAFFKENLAINLMILGVFVFAIGLSFWRLGSLAQEIEWLGRIRAATPTTDADALAGPGAIARLHLLNAFAHVWRRFFDSRQALTPDLATSLVESAQARVDERRELSRYLITALVILGLLGTFWGLLGALVSMREALGNLDSSQDFFAGLSGSLSGPLENMGTAFSSSLFGLGASLVFGFVELQTARAHATFVEDFEAWLATFVQASASGETAQAAASRYKGDGSAVAAPTNLDGLTHLMRRGQQDAIVVNNNMVTLIDLMTRVTDKLAADQTIHEKIIATQADQSILIARIETLIDQLQAQSPPRSLVADGAARPAPPAGHEGDPLVAGAFQVEDGSTSPAAPETPETPETPGAPGTEKRG